MRIEIVPVLSDNYAYLLICEASGQAAVIDPADAAAVAVRVEELGVDLVAIWNTHHHWDHTNGNEQLCRRASEAGKTLEVCGHISDAARIPQLNRGLEAGDEVALGSLRARVFHTPGHTTGALVYSVEGAAFTGDTLFGAGCGRLFEGTAEMLHRSLNETLAGLEGSVSVYCGHEYTAKNIAFARELDPDNQALVERERVVTGRRAAGQPSVPSAMAQERETNPFLRCDHAGLRAGLAARLGAEALAQDATDVEVFAALRGLRDGF